MHLLIVGLFRFDRSFEMSNFLFGPLLSLLLLLLFLLGLRSK